MEISEHWIYETGSPAPSGAREDVTWISCVRMEVCGVKIGVCGIACEKCPRMVQGKCPNGDEGCRPKENRMCKISTCAFHKGVSLCFECSDFPCETTKMGPISYGYCTFIAGKD